MKKRLLSIALFVVSLCAVFSLTLLAQPQRALSALPPANINRITSLYDAFGKESSLTRDWGYSALVEYNGKRILFDSGNNADVFKHNVETLGLDLNTIDYAVLSHPHADHLHGFDYLIRVNPNVKLFLPEDVHVLGAPRPFRFAGPEPNAAEEVTPEERYYGVTGISEVNVTPSGRFYGATAEYVRESVEIEPGIRLITTSSPYLGGFNGYPPNTPETPALNRLPELSLALETSQGEVLVVGCSHSGVERIVAETKRVSGKPVDTVAGGFHLFPYGRDEILSFATQLKTDLGVRRVSPSHCTGHLGLKIFHQVFGEEYVYGGLGSQIDFPA